MIGNGKVYGPSRIDTDKPPLKRKEINLCGIVNQGATCYLNTLIQTLFLTTEFRGENIRNNFIYDPIDNNRV